MDDRQPPPSVEKRTVYKAFLCFCAKRNAPVRLHRGVIFLLSAFCTPSPSADDQLRFLLPDRYIAAAAITADSMPNTR